MQDGYLNIASYTLFAAHVYSRASPIHKSNVRGSPLKAVNVCHNQQLNEKYEM